MTDALDPRDLMSIPSEVIDASEKELNNFVLNIPKGVERDKRSVARWTETVVVEAAQRTNTVGNEGEQNTIFTVKLKVLPVGESENVGKIFTSWMRVNFGAFAGRSDTSGKKDPKKQRIMSTMSLKKMKQFASAAGVDLSGGWTPEIFDALFPLDTAFPDATSVLNGQNFLVVMTDAPNRKFPDRPNQQDVESVVPAEGV